MTEKRKYSARVAILATTDVRVVNIEDVICMRMEDSYFDTSENCTISTLCLLLLSPIPPPFDIPIVYSCCVNLHDR